MNARAPHFQDAIDAAQAIVVKDGFWQRAIWKTVLFRPLVSIPFFLEVRRHAKRLHKEDPDTVFHYLCPVSPILPRFAVRRFQNVLGPITGNIYYPPALADREPFALRWRRISHRLAQIVISVIFQDKQRYAKILVSGGGRTRQSLKWAGARDAQMADVIDSGISDSILSRPMIRHEGENYRFVCNGRFMPHKGVDLAIRAVAKTQGPAQLDVFGKGPEEDRLKALIAELGLEDRIAMRGWAPTHDALLDEMLNYRGFIFPSMAEANGIVVQEALAMGLPVVCLNWGGPSVLTSDETARRIDPVSDDYIVDELAAEMDRLAGDPDLANRRAEAGFEDARRRFSWRAVADQWFGAFHAAVAGASETSNNREAPGASLQKASTNV